MASTRISFRSSLEQFEEDKRLHLKGVEWKQKKEIVRRWRSEETNEKAAFRTLNSQMSRRKKDVTLPKFSWDK